VFFTQFRRFLNGSASRLWNSTSANRQAEEQLYDSMQKEWTIQQQEDSFVVLVATTDQKMAEELNRAFRNREIQVLTFETARDIILAMAERKIDLMIIDPDVTELKGLEILRIIKKLRPQVRIIAMSEDLSFERRAALVQEGILYQVQTPIQPAQISEVVESIVAKLNASRRPSQTS
jgi:DNA-binding NtrC family response regulator